jgi:hypothetical protein
MSASRFAAMALMLAAAQPASAQIPSSRSGQSSLQYLSNEDGLIAIMEFGECYAKGETKKALRLLATSPSTREEAQTYVALFRGSNQACLKEIIQLNADLPMVRGAIVEGLYKKRIPIPPQLMQTVPAPATATDLSGAARCYVAGHRLEAMRLLAQTRPGSRKEFDMLGRLMPDFSTCVPKGTKLSFPATIIRFRIAEALLRTAAPAATAGAR